MTTGPTDLIVVGGGPRALYALADLDEELARRVAAPGFRPLRVVVLEAGTPGAGAVWEPSQPTHLLMNVDSRIVDASCRSVPLTFQQWHGGDGDPFPPRAEVGRYLKWSFECLRGSPRLEIVHRALRVTAMRRERESWVCDTTDVTGEPADSLRSHRVLLATGHEDGTGIDHAEIADSSRGPGSGVPVWLRGASLTAFDVVMDLTAGRAGEWVADATSASGLRYFPSGTEPSLITLVSRSGEPMLPKPVAIPGTVTQAVRRRTSAWAAGSTPDDSWWDVLADGAVTAAAAAGTPVSLEALWARLDSVSAARPDARWARDVGRALGDTDGDPAWWWGRAWSAGYADMVCSLERTPRDESLWPRWRTRAATLERWAFGPPLATHRRVLALREAGLLRVVRAAESGHPPAGTVMIDAFTRGPGVSDTARPWDSSADESKPDPAPRQRLGREPWNGLVADGHVSVRPGERGVLTTPDATCVGADGAVTVGLAALGRPTEDPVIGHDSLKRRLHGDSQRWADALATNWFREQSTTPVQLTKVGRND